MSVGSSGKIPAWVVSEAFAAADPAARSARRKILWAQTVTKRGFGRYTAEMDAIVKRANATPLSRKSTSTSEAIFGATPGMPGMFKSNFDYQLVRGMLAGAYGEGGAFGELYSTARRVVDRDINSWAVEWGRTAERIEAIAEDCLSGGHIVSAREAFLRASLYWRTGLFYLDSKDPRQ